MELNFGWPSVHHGRWPNCHDGCFRIQATWVICSRGQNLFMLLHSDIQRNIVFFGPAAQWTQPQNGLFVTLLAQIFTRRSHEVSMSGMGGISSLKCIDSVGSLVLEFLHELLGSLSPLVQSVVVPNAIQQFDFSSNQIVTTSINVFNVGMLHINNTKHARNNFFLSVFIYFRVAENGHRLSHLRDEGDRMGASNCFLRVGRTRQCDGH
mmetsp:Transcript_13155/g.27294  ORF Transcript_13155/g.27294 Transcript_13155/m.27294 type:complete len:208 (+) Transcript_13155:1428-2051(+)